MDKDLVIKTVNLSKRYKIGTKQKYFTLRESLNNLISFSREPNKIFSFWALKNISFEVKKGEVVGIIGKNGSGKSTLLKILSRITLPTSGRAEVRGRMSSLLEVGTGFNPELTGRENIYLNGAILGMKQREIKKKFDEIVDFSGIEKFIDTPVKRYSSGMYVRLAFSIAAHLDPDILVLDEVLSVGDYEFNRKSLKKMEEVTKKEGRTILFVSHNTAAINRLCNRCLLLDKGRLIMDGFPGDVTRKYLYSYSSSKNTVVLQKQNLKKELNLRKVILNPEDSEKSRDVSYEKPIVIRLEYEINKIVSNCTVWLALENENGVMVFTTADCDMYPQLLGRRLKGYYQSDIDIPGKWLNIGEYTVIVGLVQNNPFRVFDRLETIKFKVIDPGTTPASIFKDSRRRGVFQPYLKWTNKKLRNF